MKVAHLPLRTKLLAALAIPIAGLLVLGLLQVRALLNVASTADDQLTEVDNAVAIAQVARAIGSERDAQLTIAGNTAGGVNPGQGTAGADSFFARVRRTTDTNLDEILSDGSISPQTRDAIAEAQGQLAVARSAVGDDLGQVKVDLIDEMTSPEGSGETMDALVTFDQLVAETIDLIDVDPDRVLDAETSLDLTTLELSVRFDEAVRLEALAYLELALVEPADRPASLLAEARRRGAAAGEAESWLVELGSPQFNSEFEELFTSPRYQDLVDLRNDVATTDAADIKVTTNEVLSSLVDINTRVGAVNDAVIEGARANAINAQDSAQRGLLIGAVATAALVLLVGLIATALFRSIRRPLLALTNRSREIADVELPGVVTLLREEGVDAEVPEIVPIEAETKDEVGQLVVAFNDMHRTAVELASEQAASRRTVSDMFVNLGRRNQRLLIRILAYLDTLEREEEDPASLEKLFKVDHLVTRMRRNAESLLVLAGAQSARTFADPVPIADVCRSALAEVEDYERVHLDVRGDVLVDGSAVADTAHLIAELIENSLNFSPPDAPVIVIATETEDGYFIAVADRGIGMSQADMERANNRIAEAAELTETPSSYLGHHVVGTLAARHGMRVTLETGHDDEGVTAKVAVPDPLLSHPVADAPRLEDVLSDVADEVAGEAAGHAVPPTPADAAEERATAVSQSLSALSSVSRRVEEPIDAEAEAATASEGAATDGDVLEIGTAPEVDDTVEAITSTEVPAVPDDTASQLVGGLLKRRKIPKDPDAPPHIDEKSNPLVGDAELPRRRSTDVAADEPAKLVTREKGASLPAGVAPAAKVPIAEGADPEPESPHDSLDPEVRAMRHRAFASSLSGFQQAVHGSDAADIQRWYASAGNETTSEHDASDEDRAVEERTARRMKTEQESPYEGQ